MTASDKSNDTLTFDDIQKAVEALKANQRDHAPLTLMAQNEVQAQMWGQMYPGVVIYLNGEVYDNQ